MTKITDDDRNLTKNLRIEKHLGAWQMKKEFPNKNCSISVKWVIKKIDIDGTTECKRGSGHPKSARNRQNIQRVSKLICSQDDNPHSHKSPRETEKETGKSRSTVRLIVKQDLQRRKFTTIEQLKLAIIEEWRKLLKALY